MNKHTPGPWGVGYGGQEGDGFATITSPHSLLPIAELTGEAETNANARLIAAAPELLEACKALLSKESEMTTGACYLEFRAIEAAIARAEGGE